MPALLDISAFFPLRYIQARLTFTQDTTFPFLHRYILAGFLRHMIGGAKDFSKYLRLYVPENGHINYQKDESYHFGIICLAGGETLLHSIIDKLSTLPASAPFAKSNQTLNNNIKLDNIKDIFNGNTINNFEDISQLSYTAFKAMVKEFSWGHQLNLTWLSPVRIKKQPAKQKDKPSLYCADEDDLPPEKFFYHIYAHFADWLKASKEVKAICAITPNMSWTNQHCFWVEHIAKNTSDNPVHCGGMLGASTLQLKQPLSFFWQQCLFLAQFTGVGNLYSYGWGRFQISTNFPLLKPAKSLLDKAIEQPNLHLAFTHSKGKLKSAQKQNFKQPDLETLSAKVRSETYQAPDLQAWSKVKNDGSLRIMTTPCFSDKVLQRAVCQIIGPSLDKIFYQHSYGYRPNRSRQEVMNLIQKEYKNGYRWVFESDVNDFFDVIEWRRVEQRLVSLFGFDACIPLIMQWIKADLNYGKHHIKRSRGLPQGAPISPVLANLILDDFDQDMLKAGFRLIRYADDFIVLAKDKTSVIKAQNRARSSLAEHGFELHPDKTQIIHQDDGYEYLGYLFLSDKVFSVKSGKPLPAYNQAMASTALLSNKVIKPLHEYQAKQTPTENQESSQSKQEVVGKGSCIVVSGDFSKLTTLGNHLQISQEDELIQNISWQQIQEILIIGKHHISTPVLYSAMKKAVPIYFINTFGVYQGALNSGTYFSQHKDLWIKQSHYFSKPEICLALAKTIVGARAHSQLVVLRQKTKHSPKQTEEVSKITRLIKKIKSCETLAQLNGFEGKISFYYFQAIKNNLPEAWNFNGRNRRPPKDAFNVLLSLGYSSLYAYTQSTLRVSGLYPYTGFYHQKRGMHAVLASDLMEPFRYIVERVALRSVSLKRITPSHFKHENGSIRLNNEKRKQYMLDLFTRFNQAFLAKSETEPYHVFSHLHRQNQKLIACIYATDLDFKPFSLK